MRYFQAFTKISKTAYLVAFITFLMRAGQFMSLPFLAIYLAREGLFTSGQIGTILGMSGFMLSITSLINGLYVDRSAHKHTISISLFLAALCYFGFAFSMHAFYVLLLLNAGLGWFRSLVEISSVRLVMNHTEKENLSYAFSARFIGANLGVVLGPLIGAMMATHQSLMIFFIAGSINIAIAILMLFYNDASPETKSDESKTNVWDNLKEVCKDKLLVNVTIINLLLWIVYAQLDTTLPQYLAKTWKNPATLFSTLMAINAGICVVFQPIILRWAELTSLKKTGIIGSFLFCISFLLIGIHPSGSMMIFSVIIMSTAELFTLPINSLLIMRVAPKHLVASYTGLSNLGLLGLSLGPILGGFGLQWIGEHSVFLIAALFPIIVAWLYFQYVPD
jgi:MFS family permease